MQVGSVCVCVCVHTQSGFPAQKRAGSSTCLGKGLHLGKVHAPGFTMPRWGIHWLPSFSVIWKWVQLIPPPAPCSLRASRAGLGGSSACSSPTPYPGEGVTEEWALPYPLPLYPQTVCGSWLEFADTDAQSPPAWGFWFCFWPGMVERDEGWHQCGGIS